MRPREPETRVASIFMGLAMTSNPAFGAGDPELKRENFQKEIDGKKVDLYTIKNQRGMVLKITHWGAKVIQVLVPDRKGYPGDGALGYDRIGQRQAGQAPVGAYVGPHAHRSAG